MAAGLITYVVEPGISRFQVQAFASGLLSAIGHNPVIAIRGLIGEMSFREPGLQDASLVLRVDVSSLALVDEVSESDRREIERNMHRDVLETELYPEIVFASTLIEVAYGNYAPVPVRIHGNLNLHGQTRLIAIDAQVAFQGDMLRAFGSFPLWQTDFHIRLFSIAGGTLKLKDELALRFDIVARRHVEEA
jgi:polyisoprenoid-binding protein YceI